MATAVLELTKEQKKLLRTIKKDAATGAPVVVTDNEDSRALYAAGLIGGEILQDDKSKIKVWPMPETATAEATEVKPAPEEFPVDSGFEMKESERTGKKVDLYPWAKMKVTDSFLVPVTAARPTPWVSFQSTITSANRRFSTKSETEFVTTSKGAKRPKRIYQMRFALRRVAKGDTYSNGKVELQSGARVFRIE